MPQETTQVVTFLPIYVFTNTDMPLLLEQTSDRGEWAVPCLQTGILITTQGCLFSCEGICTPVATPHSQAFNTIFCFLGLQREPGGFQAADHGGDGSHQGGEEAERPGSVKFL